MSADPISEEEAAVLMLLNEMTTGELKLGDASYGPRPTKRRRTAEEMRELRIALRVLLGTEQPMSVRQVFYRMVSEGLIPKTEPDYKRIGRLLTQMRLERKIPFGWIADSTRWMRKPQTFSSLEQALDHTAKAYRRSLWEGMGCYVEVWLEKDALAGVVIDETARYDVPLMVTRGYPSLSFVAEAADQINEREEPVFIYYFGDHDPSGAHISVHLEERLNELAPAADITFERVAVTPEQITEMDLPTRPTKRSDSRSRHFIGESVELDAIPPTTLRALVAEAIEQHIDQQQLSVLEEAERSEREILMAMVGDAR